MRHLVLALPFLLVGCGEKKPPEAAGAANDDAASSITAEMPEGADAKTYAKKLVDVSMTSWSPKGASDFIYNTLDFSGAGTWKADALLKVGGEEAPCAESGTWKIDSIESADVGVVEMVVAKTNCASRENGTATRIRLTLDKAGKWSAEFR